jgi:predicted transcriptional regulator
VSDERARARARVRAARVAAATVRAELDQAIREAHAAGVPQTQIAEDSGFSRVWIRHILDQQEELT